MADNRRPAISFRFSKETVDKLNTLVENLNEVSSVKVTKSLIIETLVRNTSEKELIKLIKFFS
jgi:predicted DNA-binding protein